MVQQTARAPGKEVLATWDGRFGKAVVLWYQKLASRGGVFQRSIKVRGENGLSILRGHHESLPPLGRHAFTPVTHSLAILVKFC